MEILPDLGIEEFENFLSLWNGEINCNATSERDNFFRQQDSTFESFYSFSDSLYCEDGNDIVDKTIVPDTVDLVASMEQIEQTQWNFIAQEKGQEDKLYNQEGKNLTIPESDTHTISVSDIEHNMESIHFLQQHSISSEIMKNMDTMKDFKYQGTDMGNDLTYESVKANNIGKHSNKQTNCSCVSSFSQFFYFPDVYRLCESCCSSYQDLTLPSNCSSSYEYKAKSDQISKNGNCSTTMTKRLFFDETKQLSLKPSLHKLKEILSPFKNRKPKCLKSIKKMQMLHPKDKFVPTSFQPIKSLKILTKTGPNDKVSKCLEKTTVLNCTSKPYENGSKPGLECMAILNNKDKLICAGPRNVLFSEAQENNLRLKRTPSNMPMKMKCLKLHHDKKKMPSQNQVMSKEIDAVKSQSDPHTFVASQVTTMHSTQRKHANNNSSIDIASSSLAQIDLGNHINKLQRHTSTLHAAYPSSQTSDCEYIKKKVDTNSSLQHRIFDTKVYPKESEKIAYFYKRKHHPKKDIIGKTSTKRELETYKNHSDYQFFPFPHIKQAHNDLGKQFSRRQRHLSKTHTTTTTYPRLQTSSDLELLKNKGVGETNSYLKQRPLDAMGFSKSQESMSHSFKEKPICEKNIKETNPTKRGLSMMSAKSSHRKHVVGKRDSNITVSSKELGKLMVRDLLSLSGNAQTISNQEYYDDLRTNFMLVNYYKNKRLKQCKM